MQYDIMIMIIIGEYMLLPITILCTIADSKHIIDNNSYENYIDNLILVIIFIVIMTIYQQW